MAAQKKGIFGKADSSQMGDDDQAFLSQIEESIRSKGNEQVDAEEEARQRAEEMERIRRASGNIPVPGRSAAPAGQKPAPAETPKSNPLENDPRYREYFERLRRQKGESSKSTPATGVNQQQVAEGAKPGSAATQKVGPGSIVCFDDKSIGIYKDAVSGRDYALFYFLNPNGTIMPEGVFLQCYQAKVIGVLPEQYFAELRDADAWNRDVIVFHLADYSFVKHLDTLAEHQERKPSATKPRNQTVDASNSSEPKMAQEQAVSDRSPDRTTPTPAPAPTPREQSVDSTSSPAQAETPDDNGLVKGRRFHIKFGGKQWEAVYWTSEDENSIVAHNTHGTWSLMRLDLSRFKDSLELLDIVDSDTLNAIAEQAAAGA